ncbi:MAG: dihydropteroate synthase [Planctomycetes bacterium]|nr:dihydropteroate synthase [Planctomycetota bacterium]
MHIPAHWLGGPGVPLAPPWPLVMGIVNVTPDSFSDGGRHDTAEAGLNHALRLLDDGADILDIGGESTRPGAAAVDAKAELARVVPVIGALRRRGIEAPVSVDTSKSEVARAALDAGADIVNDVSAGTVDPALIPLCAARQCGLVLMHMQGDPRTMQQAPAYQDVVAEVRDYLAQRAKAAVAAGVKREHVWIDPGFGFGKLPAHNFALVRHLNVIASLGFAVLVGVSRKSSLGHVTGRPVEDREPESLAAALVAACKGAAVLRAHEPGPLKRAIAVARAMV